MTAEDGDTQTHSNWVVLIQGNRISAVGAASTLSTPPGTRRIELPGATQSKRRKAVQRLLNQGMRFNVSCSLEYAVAFPSTFILDVHAQRSAAQTIIDESFSTTPEVRFSELTVDGTGNRFVRIETGDAPTLAIEYRATVECNFRLLQVQELEATPVSELTGGELIHLFPSRYCQSDRLGRLAWDLFGKIDKPYDKVVAIADWIYGNVEYLRGSTDSATSAYDTVTQRTGVCRDFAHLGIALCRALNIPARYFTGYAYQLDPPDMHACFECYIGGHWIFFDATRLAHLNGLVRIGMGRDAAEASVASIFGSARLQKMVTDCQLAPEQNFSRLELEQLKSHCVSLPAEAG